VSTPDGHRRLILTRHAKSSWDKPGLDDRDRPLNGRGRKAARELGRWLASRGYLPDEVLSSDSLRTRETWAGVAEKLPRPPEPRWMPELYHADPATMLDVLRQARGGTVMMVGHNPGIGEFAATLPARWPADPDFERYPTAATLVVDFDIDDWAALEPGRGSVLDFFTPSDRGGG